MATRNSRPPLFPQNHNSQGRFVDSFGIGGGRVYDYTMKYPPDKPGEEHKENARVWNVLLDETEDYNRDMLQGFRDIIDGVLIFASLFSAVVTTLVAQTSQALQPDNAQITASLLVETNQLLRAAGNITTISTVPTSPLSVGSAVHTSKDVWVNALFFTSLAFSLSTALLTVLVKQWLHAYSSFITGDAKTRALITDFRSQGLRTWRVREIVEALPLILHGSVLLFFVGLVLYVSQLSAPICGILALVTIVAFTFYLGSSFLPSVFNSCPYKIPFLIKVGWWFIYSVCSIPLFLSWLMLQASDVLPQWLQNACQSINLQCDSLRWDPYQFSNSRARKSLPSYGFSTSVMLDSLQRLLQRTSQRSTSLVIYEAVFALFQDTENRRPPVDHQILWYTLQFSLDEYAALKSNPPYIIRMIWENRISFLKEYITNSDQQLNMFRRCYIAAERLGNEHACERVMDWIGNTALEDVHNEFMLMDLLRDCVTGNGVRRILTRISPARTAMLLRIPALRQESFLHNFIRNESLEAAKVVIEADQSDDVVNFIPPTGHTPLDIALDIRERSVDPDFVGYLMDHNARASQSSYEAAFLEGIKTCKRNPRLVRLLWSRRREVRLVDTRPDSWCRMSVVEVANKFLVRKSPWRPMLLQILQECDDHSGNPDQPPISPSVEGELSLPHPISELEETVDELTNPTPFVHDSRVGTNAFSLLDHTLLI